MKKIFFFSAIALLGLASCVDPVEVNPNYNPMTNEVNANFIFSVAANNTPATKMSSAKTQATVSEDFLGIDNAFVATYTLTSDNSRVIANTESATKTYPMGMIMGPGYLDPDGTSASSVKSRRVIELALPTGINTISFWGKAIKSAGNEQQGYVTWPSPEAFSGAVSGLKFGLNNRVVAGSDAETAFKQYETLLAAILDIVGGSRIQYAVNELDWQGTKNTEAIDIQWGDYATFASGKMTVSSVDPLDESLSISPLGEIMGRAFVELNTVWPGEARAGSGNAVLKVLSDLSDITASVTAAVPTSFRDFVALKMAERIGTNLDLFINTSTSGYKGIADIITNVVNHSACTAADFNKLPFGTSTTPLPDFPEKTFGVPMGASTANVTITQITYTGKQIVHPRATWSYPDTYLHLFTYPAELCYFGNSPIRVTDSEKKDSDYPDGVANWDNDRNWTDWTTGTHVVSSTRAVAMKENINYGSALLASTIAVETNNNGKLLDNNRAISLRYNTNSTEQDLEITPDFALSGILVGGMSKEVGWNYLPNATGAGMNYIIFDNAPASTTVPTPTGMTNYTLVWDNYDSSLADDATQQTVYVALELVNNGDRFWGKDNMVPKDGTFYLVGKLSPVPYDPTAGSSSSYGYTGSGITWPTTYVIPPYKADGTSKQITRVFIQDFKTVANFTIGVNSLKSAYVTVPDLRSTQLSLGLSVDLEWETGLIYNVTLGD